LRKGPDYTDYAQVISSTPTIERVTDQRQECVPDTAYAPAPARERSLVGNADSDRVATAPPPMMDI
jgi:hypothetical protein